MTADQFEALLARRAELREQHQGWCNDVNGRLGAGEGSYEAKRRDAVWAELQEVEATIDAEFQAERAAE